MSPADTRKSILNAAYHLMLGQGYAATGVGEICQRAGVSKGSFYHFFETKQQCALEMMRDHLVEAEQMINGLDLSADSDVEAALRFVEHIENLSEEVLQHGCLFGAFAMELAETHPELQAEVSAIFDRLAGLYEEALAPVSRHSPLADVPTPRELAEQMITVIEGGVVLSKAHGELRFLSQGLRLFRCYLANLCEPEAASSS